MSCEVRKWVWYTSGTHEGVRSMYRSAGYRLSQGRIVGYGPSQIRRAAGAARGVNRRVWRSVTGAGGRPGIAVKYPPEVIRGIADLPTPGYYDWYNRLNTLLDSLVVFGANQLRNQGYRAVAMTRESVVKGEAGYNTVLPYKTLATRAGVGWIGRCALLVNDQYGSAIRLSGILTDAPFETATPVEGSRCGRCVACVRLCPAQAINGREWSVGVCRDELVDAPACRKVARERAGLGFGRADVTICGKCIEVCPYTRKYLRTNGMDRLGTD